MMIRAKIFEYLAAAKPVVAGASGETAGILRSAGAVVVPPEDNQAFVRELRRLLADPGRRTKIGEAGEAFVRRHYDRRTLAERYRALLHLIVETR
jgi:glycosyltransferase involved in cell wall biosynthesis